MSGTPGGLIARAEPDPGTGPASPDGGPPQRRRSLAAILIVGFAVICLIGLGAFATVLLLHGRTHARPAALPSVFQLRVVDCINSGQDGISSPTVVPCGQAHDAEPGGDLGERQPLQLLQLVRALAHLPIPPALDGGG